MRSLLVRKKKFFFIGGLVALLVLAGAILVNKLQPQEVNAYENRDVNLTIPGDSNTGYFKVDGQTAWCVTPSLADPEADSYSAVYYTLDELKAGRTTDGYDLTRIRQMFVAYYYASENGMLSNNEAMHWGLAHLYQGLDRNTGSNAGQVWDWGQKEIPSNISSGYAIMIPTDNVHQAIFTATYEIKTTNTQNVTIKKVWRDGLDAGDHNVSIEFNLRDASTNAVVEHDFLNVENGWTKSYSYEVDANSTPRTFKIEEVIRDGSNGYEIVDGTKWHNTNIDTANDGTQIFYALPQVVSCGTSNDHLTNDCTLLNRGEENTKINIWTTKHWADTGFASEYRPTTIAYKVHAFIYRNNAYELVDAEVAKAGNFRITKSGDSNSNEWGGYASGFASKVIIDGTEYDIVYAVEEINVPAAYSLSCDGNTITVGAATYCKGTQKDDGDYEVEWTNSIDKITVTAKKHWNDGGNAAQKRPSIIAFKIFRSVNGGTSEYYRTEYMTGSSSSNDWSKNISLVKKDTEGNNYEYTYQEIVYYDRVAKTYTSTNYILDGDVLGFDTSNTTGMVNTAKIDIPVKKCWVDKDDSKRPGTLVFNLYQGNSTIPIDHINLTKADAGDDGCWTGEFEDLAAYDDNGDAMTYRVEEVASTIVANNYETSVACTVDVSARIENSNSDMSCEFTNYQKVDIPVQKCWIDKDEAGRPGKLTFNLYSYTQGYGLSRLPIRTLELTSANLDNDGCWSGTFEDLPAYDKSTNNAYTYIVKEDLTEIDNYEPEEDDGDSCVVDIAGRYTRNQGLTCSFTNVELVDIPVKKVWAEDKKEDRPGSIEVSLLCGKTVLDTVTLSEENNLDGDNTWEYTWKNRRVDECEQGYSVAENINVPGYATKITGNAEDGFVITNTKTLDEILTWGGLGAGSFGVIAAGFFIVKRKLFDR